MKFVLDTNVFNHLLDGRFELASILNACGFVATKVQLQELKRTKDPIRRGALLGTFEQVDPEVIPAAFSFDIPGAGLNEGKWSTGESIAKLRADLEALNPKFNNWHDALIAGVALEHGYGLVTSDADLALAELRGFGGVATAK